MTVGPDFDVRIADYPFNPRESGRHLVRVQKTGSRPLYYVYIRLEGPDVPLVRDVTYWLHPSVSPPETTVPRTSANSDCMLQLWLWGTFETRGVVNDIKGRRFELPSHILEFDSFFAKDKFEKYKLFMREEGGVARA